MPLQDINFCISNNTTVLISLKNIILSASDIISFLISLKDIILCTDRIVTFVISSSEATHYPSNLTAVSLNVFYSSEKSAYPT